MIILIRSYTILPGGGRPRSPRVLHNRAMMRWMVSLLLSACLLWGADLTGTWKGVAKTPAGREHKVVIEEGSIPFDEVTLADGELTLKFQYEGSYTVKLKVQGDALEGNYTSSRGESGTVRATR